MITHSQVRLRTCVQPSRSRLKDEDTSSEPVAGGLGGNRTRVSASVASRNVAASAMIAQPGPVVATSTPAIAGPRTIEPRRAKAMTALACCRCAGATS